MRILALETTDKAGGVAVLQGANVLAALDLNATQRSAQALLPAIRELFTRVEWKPAEVQLIAVAVGPGSFTGLRVGVTVAKTLAYATAASVLGVNALEVIASRAPELSGAKEITTVMDAQRSQLFVGRFERAASGVLQWIGEAEIVEQADWLAGLRSGAAVTGPALANRLDRLPAGVTTVDRQVWNPTAAAVGQLAWQHHQAGRRDDLWKLSPLYLRPSAAEEKWNRQHGV